jgi:hypothetical protein
LEVEAIAGRGQEHKEEIAKRKKNPFRTATGCDKFVQFAIRIATSNTR